MAITQATQLADFTSGIGTAGAILEVDNVNNKIGIGTTNPQALLQVGQIIKMDGPSGIVTATTFSGNFTGNITGTATGLSGTPNITVNNIIGVGATFTGQVTYEDVTNIDSIGIVTARSGIHVDDSITHIGDTNTKIRFPSADTFTVETSGVERLRVGSTGTVGVAGLSTATSFGAFNHLSAPFGGGTVTYTVTVASKTADHRYNGSGSGNGYLIDGVEAPFLTLTPGRTYRFTNDNTGSHPLKFYLEADKTTLYSTGVTFDNAYTEIVVSDSTPQVLHYQCTNHSLMGNAVQTNSNIGGGFNVADESSDTTCFPLFATAATGTALAAKSGTNLTFNSSTGALTATSFVGAVTGAATQVTVADESSDTTCFPLFATAATGDLAPKSGTNLTFNSSTGALTATSFAGNITGGTGSFSGDVTLQANLDLQDDDKILLGTGDDLEIYHDATNSYIDNNTGSFYIRSIADDLYLRASDDIFIQPQTNESGINVIGNGAVELFYDGNKKLETKSDGVDITGELQCDSLDVDGVGDITGFLTLHGGAQVNNDFTFDGQTAGRDIRFDRSEDALEFEDNAKAMFGTGQDLQIYHDGTDSRIHNSTGSLIFRTATNYIFYNSDASEKHAQFLENAAVELYYDNSKKLETSSAGVTVTGTLNATTALTQDGKGLATTGKAIAMAMVFG